MNFIATFKYLYFTKICKGNLKNIFDSRKALLLVFGSVLFLIMFNYYNCIDQYLILGLSILIMSSVSFLILSTSLEKSTYKVLEVVPVRKETVVLCSYFVDFIHFLLNFLIGWIIPFVFLFIKYNLDETLRVVYCTALISFFSFFLMEIFKGLALLTKSKLIQNSIKFIYVSISFVFLVMCKNITCISEFLDLCFSSKHIFIAIGCNFILFVLSLIILFLASSFKKEIILTKKSCKKKDKIYSLKNFCSDLSQNDPVQKAHTLDFIEKGVIVILLFYLLFLKIDYNISFDSIMMAVGINMILCSTYTYYNLKYGKNPEALKILDSLYGYQNYEIKKEKLKSTLIINCVLSAFVSLLIFSKYSIIYFIILISLSFFFMFILLCFSKKLIPYSTSINISSKEEDCGMIIIAFFAILYEALLLTLGSNIILLIIMLAFSIILSLPFINYLISNQNKLYKNFKQKKLYDCGLASLRTLLYYYEIEMTDEQYNLELSKKTKAFSFNDLINIGSAYGIELIGYECDQISKINLSENPVIVQMKSLWLYHFVVVYEINNRYVIIGDPAYSNSRKISIKKFNCLYQKKLLIREGWKWKS